MSERDYSRLRPTLRPTGCAFSHEGELADTLLDLMDRLDEHNGNLHTAADDHAELRSCVDALAKRIAAIERAATCGTGPNEPFLSFPAQADVGEASAVSQPPFAVGQVVECVDAGVGNGVENGERYTVEAIRKAANPKVAWLVDVGNGGSVFAHRFRPTPAPVEQGPTAGMKKAANMLGYHDDHHQYPQISCVLEVLQKHIGPELAAKDAEIVKLRADNVRLKDDCTVAVNNIGYRSQELKEARAEIERLRMVAIGCEDDAHEAVKRADEACRQLTTRTRELDEARNERTALRIELSNVKTKYLEQAKELATARRELGEVKAECNRIDEWNTKLLAENAQLAEMKDNWEASRLLFENLKKALDTTCPGDEGLITVARRLKAQVSDLTAKLAEAERQLSEATAANVERDQLYSDCHQELTALVESVRAFQRLTGVGFDIEVGKQNRWIRNHPLAARDAAEGNG